MDTAPKTPYEACQQACRRDINDLTNQLLDLAMIHTESNEMVLFTNGTLDDVRRYWKHLIDFEEEEDPMRLPLVECLVSMKVIEQRLDEVEQQNKLAEDMKKVNWNEPEHGAIGFQPWQPDESDDGENQFNFVKDNHGTPRVEGWSLGEDHQEDIEDDELDWSSDDDVSEDSDNDDISESSDYDDVLELFLDDEFANDFDNFVNSFDTYYNQQGHDNGFDNSNGTQLEPGYEEAANKATEENMKETTFGVQVGPNKWIFPPLRFQR